MTTQNELEREFENLKPDLVNALMHTDHPKFREYADRVQWMLVEEKENLNTKATEFAFCKMVELVFELYLEKGVDENKVKYFIYTGTMENPYRFDIFHKDKNSLNEEIRYLESLTGCKLDL